MAFETQKEFGPKIYKFEIGESVARKDNEPFGYSSDGRAVYAGTIIERDKVNGKIVYTINTSVGVKTVHQREIERYCVAGFDEIYVD